jgi:hypothetical protein
MSKTKGSASRGNAGPAPVGGLRWRTIVILCVACLAVLAASLAVAFTTGSAKPAARASQPPLVLEGKLTKRIPWAKLPTTVIWNGRKDPDNRHKELQATFRGQSIYKLVGLVDDKDPKTFNVAQAKRGYGVKFIASDGYTHTMSSRDIVGKRKWIVAKLKNGRPLPKAEGPYRNVGSFVGFLAGPSVKLLVRIELVFE